MSCDLNITFNELLNEIMMNLSNKILVLEGKSDKKFIKYIQDHYVDEYVLLTVEEVDGDNNKQKVIKMIKTCQQKGFKKVFGLIDKDYDSFNDDLINLPNLYYYTENDLESVLYKINFERMYELISKDKPKKTYLEADEIIKKSLKPFSVLRYINHTKKLKYNFKDFSNYNKFFDKKHTIWVDENKNKKYIYECLRISNEHRDIFDVEYQKFSFDYEKLIKGHDLIEMLVVFINDGKVHNKEKLYNNDIIVELLIAAYKTPKINNCDLIIDNLDYIFAIPNN